MTLRQSTANKMTILMQYGEVNDIDDYDVHNGIVDDYQEGAMP